MLYEFFHFLRRRVYCGSLNPMEKQSEDLSVKSDRAKTETDEAFTVYEVSYLFLPSMVLDQVSIKTKNLKDMLVSLNGVIISDEDPNLIDLAYPMTKVVGTARHRVTSGYFGWVKFNLSKGDKNEIETVKKNLDADAEIIRYLIVKTVREDTLLNGKMKFQKEDKRRKEETESVLENIAPEATKESMPEEIDKSIDDLVIV